MVIDGDVSARSGRVGLDLDHPTAVRREHAVPGGSREVDRLVDLVGEVHVGAGRVARVVGRDDLRWWRTAAAPAAASAAARRSGRSRAQLEWQIQRRDEQPGGRGERSDGHVDSPNGRGGVRVTRARSAGRSRAKRTTAGRSHAAWGWSAGADCRRRAGAARAAWRAESSQPALRRGPSMPRWSPSGRFATRRSSPVGTPFASWVTTNRSGRANGFLGATRPSAGRSTPERRGKLPSTPPPVDVRISTRRVREGRGSRRSTCRCGWCG